MKRVLLGDDDPQYRSSMKRAFFRGWDVVEAGTSQELVEQARACNFSLIVTDNDYEDGVQNGGIVAMVAIRKFDQKTPIYFHSGYLSEEKERAAREAGATFVFKKDSFKELKGIVAGL